MSETPSAACSLVHKARVRRVSRSDTITSSSPTSRKLRATVRVEFYKADHVLHKVAEHRPASHIYIYIYIYIYTYICIPT
jgi:hypothetical protein